MTTTPAGWYPDPEGSPQLRWWDGTQWTDHRSAPPVAGSATPYSATASELKAPEGTPWNTVWIWLLVVLPFLPSFGLLAVDWSTMFAVSPGNEALVTLGILTDPGYLITTFGGFIVFGLGLWFAYLDWRDLTRRGVPRPFHWAWNLLSPVYAIGRSVVVRRRTGHGISPMWVTIGLMVVSVIFTIYLSTVIISLAFSEFFNSADFLTT